ncbi:unnamed protein product [Lymnaea stagnalis]|uniref:Uncharacterized protein n=1 Tax=Lymnaea stagnalis TaxID=6523 RepID=A0AAV2ICM6_LYMST
MFQCVRNQLKTADEKLRSIGKHQHQSATVVQTQNFTYYKSPPKQEQLQQQEQEQLQHPHQQLPRQQNPQLDSKQQERARHQEKKAPEAASEKVSQPASDPNGMASRAIARQGIRERNGLRVAADELERSELKRRSRSEGPNRRVRQSMDEREGGKKQTYDGGGRFRREQDSPDSEDSDDMSRPAGFGRANSDSDSDPKKWTKNPLIVRRMKRSDKKEAEKRLSGTENGTGLKPRDSFYQGVDQDASSSSLGGSNSGSRDGGGSSGGKGSSKYQKLEEMRKRRINLSVTSDEESTPASRISRLRQRAIQSGLGEQAKATVTPTPVKPIDVNQYDNVKNLRLQQRPQPEPTPQSFISPVGQRLSSNNTGSVFSRPAPPARPQYTPEISPVKQPTSYDLKTYSQPHQSSQQGFSTSVQAPRQVFQPVPKTSQTTSSQYAPAAMSVQPKQTVINQGPGQKQAPARPPPPSIPAAKPAFYTFPEPNPAQTTRALYNSSPEVAVRRFTTQVRVPSADSILESEIRPSSQSTIFGQSKNGPVIISQPTSSSRLPSRFNEVVELRLKNSRVDSKPKPQQKIPRNDLENTGVFSTSEDSLDELIESNIQYLDSEIDKAKAKRSSQIVSRSSSLPDPRRLAGHASSTPSLRDQPTIQVQASTSIQFHVSLPQDTRQGGLSGPPVIKIAPSNSVEYQPSYVYDSQLRSQQPDVVPRKYSYDSHALMSRPNSEYFDRDDLSKSDSQLNAQVVIPSYLGNNLHPDQAYARGCVSDINLRSDTMSGLQIPQMDKGMFSDVEYDIEVSERVKKWETFMKVQDIQTGNEKKNANLTTIQEHEGDALMLPSEVRKSVLMSKQGEFGTAYPRESTYTPPTKQRQFSSDTSINRSVDTPPKLFSVEANAHRFFQVVQDPQTGPRLGVQSQSVSSVFQAPLTIKADKSYMSANELRQHMLSNRQNAIAGTPAAASSSPAVIHYAPGYNPISSSQDESTPVVKRSPTLGAARDIAKRGSRYQEELNEISSVKSDSVVNLRRRFDTDSATMTSEDDQKSVSTASTRLSRPSKISPTQKESDSVDWSKMIPGYQSKIKDSEVWSPNLESTQGVPVSIERVTARTLQTIPFSEDPFWKEIEEMTSFDPSSMAGHLSFGNTQDRGLEQVKSQYQVELTPPHSSTLPNQPRSNLMSTKDRMHRSKSLYTPNITPLSINVDKAPSSAVSALDEVLDDIGRSSIERKQLSPKKRAYEMESNHNKTSGAVKHDPTQPSFKFEGGQFTFIKPTAEPQPAKTYDTGGGLVQMRAEQIPVVAKQPLQFYQQQRQQNQGQAATNQPNRQSQMLAGSVNNYQLDPDLLKQKLLSTGLVVETDTEDNPPVTHYRSGSLGSAVPSFRSYSNVAPSYTKPSNVDSNFTGKSVTTTAYITPQTSAFTQPILTPVSKPQNQSGTSALDEIQKALAPFRSTSYQPGPESLYGTAKFESFKDAGFDTTRGPNTKSTGWAYKLPSKDTESRFSNSESPSRASAATLQQVNESMDDLKDLAQTVERRINVIKLKLQSADEKSLDSILSSLKKLTPEVKTSEAEPSSFEDYYTTKKSKLSDALAELDRIYKSLELKSEDLASVTERARYKPYQASKSNEYIFAPQPKSEHLKPMQTRISSFYMPGLEQKSKKDLDKETESEFDIISKSFQAIVDEVNQTTDMLCKAVERTRHDNTAPETQKQTFKITLKPGETSQLNTASANIARETAAAKEGPSPSTKPQEVKAKGGRFRSRIPEPVTEDDPSVKKNRSKSVPGMDSSTSDLLNAALDHAASDVSKTTTTTVTASTNGNQVVNPTPASKLRSRMRPVRDNKIIQDDRTRRGSNEKILGMPPSPQPSPKVTRKIIYNNGLDLDLKLQPPQMFQDMTKEGSTVLLPKDQLPAAKLQGAQVENKNAMKVSEGEVTSSYVAMSPASQKKIPPPTAAKPSIRTEVAVPSLPKTTSKQELPKAVANLKLNVNKPTTSDSGSTSGVTVTSSAASTASISLTPPVFEGGQPKLTAGQQTTNDSESSSSGGHRSKRRLGTGVAMMLDRFNSSEDGVDKLKKRLGTRSAPDLVSSANDDADHVPGDQSNQAAHAAAKISSAFKVEEVTPSPQIKCSVDKIRPLNLSDAKSTVTKSTVVSSLERKLTDPEARATSSGTSSPQPSSPNKPPLHPWKRLPSDPDKQGPEGNVESTLVINVGSPKVVSKITRTINPGMNTPVSPTESLTPNGNESPGFRRVRPPNRKIQTDSSGGRPHSFHELISCFEKDPSRLQRLDRFRKCASADAVNTEVLVDKIFRSEPDLTAPSGDQETWKNEVVLKFEMKLKS